MDKPSLIFCVGISAACLLLAVIMIPLASVSDTTLARAKSVVAADKLGIMNLGKFGKVPVKDLIDYYVENPPEQKVGSVREVRFEGC